MKKVIILFLFIFSTYGFSQDKDTGLNAIDENGLKQGTWIEYTPNGNALSFTTYKDNNYHGVRIKFYSDRNMMRLQEHYKMGIQNGEQFYYDTGGRLIRRETFVDGTRNGPYLTYYNTKKKKEEHNYLNGNKHGLCIWYYDDGDIMSEYTYVKGNIEGIVKNYYKGNILKSSVIFENNEMNGTYQEFYKEEGTLKVEGVYKVGKKEGVWTYYTSNGRKEKTEKYRNGNKI